jgi:hypothetical protein
MAKTLLSMQDLQARALAEIRKQPGCSNVRNIAINHLTDEGEGKMTPIDKLLTWAGMLAALGAAVLWLWASLVEVPDNIDTIVGEFQRIGRLNAWAALAALVGALCAAYGFWRKLSVDAGLEATSKKSRK